MRKRAKRYFPLLTQLVDASKCLSFNFNFDPQEEALWGQFELQKRKARVLRLWKLMKTRIGVCIPKHPPHLLPRYSWFIMIYHVFICLCLMFSLFSWQSCSCLILGVIPSLIPCTVQGFWVPIGRRIRIEDVSPEGEKMCDQLRFSTSVYVENPKSAKSIYIYIYL